MRIRVAALVLCVLAAGCGAGAGGERPSAVKLTVTEDFGSRTVLERTTPETGAGDTVMRLLQRNAEVDTRYGGGFVQAIDGISGGREGGRPVDWFFYVNGILEDEGASAVTLHEGDRVWWDRRDWGTADRVPAVVGSYPEPFVSGLDGERRPVRLECDEGVEAACDAITDKLAALDVLAGRSRLGTEQGEQSVRILVGRWPEVRGDRAAVQLEQGPKSSGVYAWISEDGRTITALGERGEPVRRLGPGTGLIFATRFRQEDPVWVVTGTDAAGVRLAAEQAFDESVLNEKFALAVADGLPVPLPVTGESP